MSLPVLFSFVLLLFRYRLDVVESRLLSVSSSSFLFSSPLPLPLLLPLLLLLPPPPLYPAYSPVECDTFFDLFLTPVTFFVLDPGDRVLRLASTSLSGRRHYCT